MSRRPKAKFKRTITWMGVDFGLPRQAKDEDRVPKLERRSFWATSVGVPEEIVTKAWKAYDVTLVVSDRDHEAADRAYQAVIRQWRQHGKVNP